MKGCGRRRSSELTQRLRTLPENPRVVVSGNMAVPWEAVRALDAAQPTYVLHALNAPAGLPDARGRDRRDVLRRSGYASAPAPALRAVPALARPAALRPRAAARRVLLHCAPPRHGQVSMGLEVNVLPAALEACRARGGLVVAVVNPQMPYTFGDAEVPLEHVDLMVEVDSPMASLRAPRRARPREPGHRRARRGHGQGRRDDAARHRRRARRHARRTDVAPRPAHVDRDVLRRRARPRRGGRARSRPPARHLVQLRLDRPLRVARRQPARADDAHREDERPRPHRVAAADDVGQHGARGRPLRPGQRLAHQRPHPLRVRRTDRLHRGPPRRGCSPGWTSSRTIRSASPATPTSSSKTRPKTSSRRSRRAAPAHEASAASCASRSTRR